MNAPRKRGRTGQGCERCSPEAFSHAPDMAKASPLITPPRRKKKTAALISYSAAAHADHQAPRGPLTLPASTGRSVTFLPKFCCALTDMDQISGSIVVAGSFPGVPGTNGAKSAYKLEGREYCLYVEGGMASTIEDCGAAVGGAELSGAVPAFVE